jgi:hypothetical protein
LIGTTASKKDGTRNIKQMEIQFNIQRLILDGIDIPTHQRPLLQAAVETELAQLMESNGPPARWQTPGALSSLRVGTIDLTSDSDAQRLGQQIARSFFEGGDL